MSLPPLPPRATPYSQGVWDQSAGALLICAIISAILYGSSALQTHVYYYKYSCDSTGLKTLVCSVMLAATVQIVLVFHASWHYLIFSYTNPFLIGDGVWSLYSANIAMMLIIVMVQGFYMKMIYHLIKGTMRNIITASLTLLLLAQFAAGVAATILEFEDWETSYILGIARKTIVPMLAFRIASDTITAVVLCVLLNEARSEFHGSNRLLHTLIIYAVNRFLLITVIVIVQTIVLIVKSRSIWAVITDYIVVQLYVCSFLATLNSREYLRGMRDGMSLFTPSTPLRAANPSQTNDTRDAVAASGRRGGQFGSKHSRLSSTTLSTEKPVALGHDQNIRFAGTVHLSKGTLSDLE